jgi:hypothetical protein
MWITGRCPDGVIISLTLGLILFLPCAKAGAQETPTLDQILRGAHQAELAFEKKLQDYVCRATTTVSEPQGDGTLKISRVVEKTIYRKLPDLRREQCHSVVEGDRVLSPQEVAEYEKNQKWDKSTSNRRFFSPEQRQKYIYQLLPPDTVRGIPTYVIQLMAQEKERDLVNGTVWLHRENFEIIQLDFRPALNPRFAKEIHMVIQLDEVQPGYWLPSQLDIQARGGFLFIKKQFVVHEDWYQFDINPGLPDSLFAHQE